MLMLRARGWSVVEAARSQITWAIPWRDSNTDALRPTGPAPTIRTGVSTAPPHGLSRSSGLDPATDSVDAKVCRSPAIVQAQYRRAAGGRPAVRAMGRGGTAAESAKLGQLPPVDGAAMRNESPRSILLAEYRPPAFLVDEGFLEVELDPRGTGGGGRQIGRAHGCTP